MTPLRASAILSLLLLLLAGCEKPPLEEAIAGHIHDMADAVETRSARGVNRHIAEHFRLDRGGHEMDREEARRMMTAIFMRHRDISVRLTNVRVEPDPGSQRQARARFNALVTGGSGGILPDTAQLYRVDTDWERIDDDWMLVSASARRAME